MKSFLFLLLSFNAIGCINKIERIDIKKLVGENRESAEKFMLEINQSVELIMAGKHQQAINQLLKIEQEHPGHYATATNLGTAYELNGDNESANLWIRKGIELNPEAHEGTEWLHYEILKAKINLSTDHDWLKENSVFDVSNIDLDKGLKALEYQLSERIQFVSPPNQIVADLYYLQGLLNQQSGNNVLMNTSFKASLKYGGLRKQKIDEIKRKQRNNIESLIELNQ